MYRTSLMLFALVLAATSAGLQSCGVKGPPIPYVTAYPDKLKPPQKTNATKAEGKAAKDKPQKDGTR